MTPNKSKREFTEEHKAKIRQGVINYFANESQEAREKRINNLKAFWAEVRKKLNKDNTKSRI